MKSSKPVTTFDRIMKDPKRRRKLERKYRSFLLSDVIHGFPESTLATKTECSMDHLDRQMQQWSTRLRDDLKIGPPESNQLATTIRREVAGLSDEAKQRVKDASQVPLEVRIEELIAFQGWMDWVRATNDPNPVVVRAQVIYQNYICFVYLGDSCFNVLKRELPSGSTGKKCCRFLTDNPVRAFRNAIAHANWRYLPDFSGLEYWARKGAAPTEPLVPFEVLEQDLSFWQALARCAAYASFLTL